MEPDYCWILPDSSVLPVRGGSLHIDVAMDYLKSNMELDQIADAITKNNGDLNVFCISDLGWVRVRRDSVQARDTEESILNRISRHFSNHANIFSKKPKMFIQTPTNTIDLDGDILNQCNLNLQCAIFQTKRNQRFMASKTNLCKLSCRQLLDLIQIFSN